MKVSFYNAIALITALALTLSVGCRRDPVRRAMVAIERNNPSLAESLLADLAESNPNDPSVQANLALARMKLGQADAALAGFRRTADLVPDDPRPLEFMADMAATDGRWRMSLELLLEAERRNPRSPRLQTALAIAEMRISGPQAARTRLLQVLNSAPNYSPALFNLAILMQDHLNTPAEAAHYFERYLAIPGDLDHKEIAHEALARLRAETAPNPATSPVVIRSQPAQHTPSRENPATITTTPITPSPAKPTTRRIPAAIEAYNSGVRNQSGGNLDRAAEDYSRALRADPAMAGAHYNLGLIFLKQGKTENASQAFQYALALDPEMIDARYMLALVLREQGRPDAAIEHLRSLLAQKPAYAQAHHALGLILAENPSTRALARREFEIYIELAPSGPYTQIARDWIKHNP